MTLRGLREALDPIFEIKPSAELSRATKRATAQVRGVEARLADLEPRSEKLGEMIARIENADSAADELPVTLQDLSDASGVISKARRDVDQALTAILIAEDKAGSAASKLTETQKLADAVLARCESAYSAATSQGLAAAFSDRSKSLDHSMWAWVVGLVGALGIGATFGANQLHALGALIVSPGASASAVVINIVFSVLSIGAPVWFAWLATKQVGQRFRLSEDYAFKASISKAYEGYRREAARVDKDLEARLLASALDRLDELPLRWVEADSHGSPLQEAMNSPVVRDAAKTIPGFAAQVVDLAKQGIAKASSRATATKPDATPPATV